jgi:hypothetical protein
LGYAPLMLHNTAIDVGNTTFLTDAGPYTSVAQGSWFTVATYDVIQKLNNGSSFNFNCDLWGNGTGPTVQCRLLLNDTYVIGTNSAVISGWTGVLSTVATSADWDIGSIKVQLNYNSGGAGGCGVRNISFTGEYTPFIK